MSAKKLEVAQLIGEEAARLFKQYRKEASLKKGGGLFQEKLNREEWAAVEQKAMRHAELRYAQGLVKKAPNVKPCPEDVPKVEETLRPRSPTMRTPQLRRAR